MPTPQSVFDQMIKEDHCSNWLGVELLEIKEGYCRLRMAVRKEMLNGFGMLHGGMAYTFADSAFAFASNSYGRLAVSIQGSMNFAHSAHEGDVLIAEAKQLNLTHRTGDFDVNIYLENRPEQILYYFRGTVYRSSKEIG